jgi:hypothetical protein
VILLLWLLTGIGLLSLLIPAGVKLTRRDWAGARRHEPLSASNEGETNPENVAYRPNTNLEQISDWLTKILVGVGLTQMPEIIGFFKTIATEAGPAFGDTPSGKIIAVSIVVHYILAGFFQGFLLAYLWLPGAFARAMEELRQKRKSEEDPG